MHTGATHHRSTTRSDRRAGGAAWGRRAHHSREGAGPARRCCDTPPPYGPARPSSEFVYMGVDTWRGRPHNGRRMKLWGGVRGVRLRLAANMKDPPSNEGDARMGDERAHPPYTDWVPPWGDPYPVTWRGFPSPRDQAARRGTRSAPRPTDSRRLMWPVVGGGLERHRHIHAVLAEKVRMGGQVEAGGAAATRRAITQDRVMDKGAGAGPCLHRHRAPSSAGPRGGKRADPSVSAGSTTRAVGPENARLPGQKGKCRVSHSQRDEALEALVRRARRVGGSSGVE